MQCYCTAIGSCSAIKTEQWLGSGAAGSYGGYISPKPARMGRVSGYTSARFAMGSSGLHRLSRTAARNAVLVPVSQGDNRVRSLSILHSYCYLFKNHMGNAMLWWGGGGCIYIYIYAFSRCFYPKRLTVHSGYTCIVGMRVLWELNPQPFMLLTQCSTTEPQEH